MADVIQQQHILDVLHLLVQRDGERGWVRHFLKGGEPAGRPAAEIAGQQLAHRRDAAGRAWKVRDVPVPIGGVGDENGPRTGKITLDRAHALPRCSRDFLKLRQCRTAY